jgi:hypothetical protein
MLGRVALFGRRNLTKTERRCPLIKITFYATINSELK